MNVKTWRTFSQDCRERVPWEFPGGDCGPHTPLLPCVCSTPHVSCVAQHGRVWPR